MQHFILTIYGEAQPGVFEDIAKLSHAQGSDWQTSKVSRIGNHVAILIKGCIESANYAALQSALTDAFKQLHFVFSDVDEHHVNAEKAVTCMFDCTDKDGLSHELSTALTANKLSVTSLHIHRYPVIGGASPVFSAEIKLVLSDDYSEDAVKELLASLADDARIFFSSNNHE